MYAGWTEEEVQAHLSFHANDGTLMVTENEGKITSVCVWKQIKDFDGDIQKIFWERTDPSGEDVYLHELVSTDGVSVDHMLDVFCRMDSRAPSMTYWAHRKDKLRKYNFRELRRFTCHHRKHRRRQITPPQTERV